MSFLKTRAFFLTLSCCSLAAPPLCAEKNTPPSLQHIEKKTLPLQFTASYTLWAPYQEGMNIAYSVGDTIESGNTIRPTTYYRSGFIVGAGWNSYHDNWTVSSRYTLFYNYPKFHEQNLKVHVPYQTPFSAESFQSDTLHSQFANWFNRVDMTIDRSFFTGRFIAIRPWMGILGAWEESQLNFNMKADEEYSEATDITQYQFTQNWSAIGPYAGIEGTYYLVKQFGFFLSSGIALCKANHTIKQHISTVDDEYILLDIPPVNTETLFRNIEPMVEASIGIRCDMEWKKFTLRVQSAWQLQTYFSHNGFQGYYSPLGLYGNYSMEGLTAGFTCTF
ncbi:MAG: hypothetical protein SP4CHLAM5_07150 [Chlamydiia bacterium]|nr:hypothetical protein [Chlamydiia bacterium]MCH9618582.1 hypothetical protein [Chlamydiia bacterium]MCH9623879.1 hypothetical protein [Chlamydiia bacterium]